MHKTDIAIRHFSNLYQQNPSNKAAKRIAGELCGSWLQQEMAGIIHDEYAPLLDELRRAKQLLERVLHGDHLWDYGSYPGEEKSNSTAEVVEKIEQLIGE